MFFVGHKGTYQRSLDSYFNIRHPSSMMHVLSLLPLFEIYPQFMLSSHLMVISEKMGAISFSNGSDSLRDRYMITSALIDELID